MAYPTPLLSFIRLLPAVALAIALTGCDWATVLGGDPDDSRDSGDSGDSGEDLPAVASQVAGFELGVSDLDLSVPVYRDGLGMVVVDEAETARSQRVTLASPVAPFEATLTLIEFTDGLGRNLQDNPGKIVFYTMDAVALSNQFANGGGRVTVPPEQQDEFRVVGFGRDPDNNLIEIAEVPQAGATYLSAVGIGVSDLERARDFYDFRAGLDEQQFRTTERYDEYTMGTAQGRPSLSLVLMHWTDGSEPRYRGNETRIRLVSEDPEATNERTWSEDDGRTQDLDGNQLIIDEDPTEPDGDSVGPDDVIDDNTGEL